LGLFVVSVSILKGVIVKSELLPRFSSARIKIRVGIGVDLWPPLNAKGLRLLLQTEHHLEGAEIAIKVVQWPVAFQHTSVDDCFQQIHLQC
jgi:hypothetical protein